MIDVEFLHKDKVLPEKSISESKTFYRKKLYEKQHKNIQRNKRKNVHNFLMISLLDFIKKRIFTHNS